MSRFLNPELAKIEAYIPGEQPRDMKYIKLNTNESPYPPSPSVLYAANEEEIKKLRLYSDPESKELKNALAALYALSPKNICVSNGSDEILNFAFLAFGKNKSGSGAVFPKITYGFYPVFANLYGIEAERIPLRDNFSINPDDYVNKNKLTVIANPNAPTGISLTKEEIRKIVSSNPDGVVVIDEAYVDFGGETCYELIKEYDNLLVIRTFSKSRSMAGARLGFAFASEAIIEDLEKIRYSTNPYNVNRLTQLLGIKALEENDYYIKNCEKIIKTRENTAKALKELGFTVLPSKTNFLFAKSEKISGGKLYEELKKRGVLIRHFSDPEISNFNRITIGSEEEMTIFVDKIKEILRLPKTLGGIQL